MRFPPSVYTILQMQNELGAVKYFIALSYTVKMRCFLSLNCTAIIF